MKQIEITVRDKIARLVDINTVIVCGNSDYVAVFDFDSEWDAYDVKTARYKWNGKYEEKVFTGTQCAIPIIKDAVCVEIGVYAGNISTTTGVRVPTQKSILCGSPIHNEPEPDVYNQIIALLESMEGVSEEEIAAAVEKYLTENPLDGVTSVNNKTGAVTLGASDVGAIPVPETATLGQVPVVKSVDENGKPTEWQAADMPSGGTTDIPEALPNPYALTFTGAVTGSYDGSEAVTVNIPSGGGGASGMTLLGEIDCSAVSGDIKFTDLDNYTEFYIIWDGVKNDGTTASGYRCKINNIYVAPVGFVPIDTTSVSYGWSYAKYNGLVWMCQISVGSTSNTLYTFNHANGAGQYNHVLNVGKAMSMSLIAPLSQYQAVSGTIKVYGR